MCGICGFTGSIKDNTGVLKAMCDVIAHRGPDGEGRYFDEGIALGHRRLSLIDLASGAQPMVRADRQGAPSINSPHAGALDTGDFAIVFNGEIYNYKDLRVELETLGYRFETSSDTEVLLVSYIAWGRELFDRIRGMFAFAIWDRAEQELFCARDFFGIKPFYYSADSGGNFIFASEIKSILEFPGVKRELNEAALEQYLSFQYSVLPETFFKGIHKLPPAHYLVVKPGEEPVIKRYWQIDYAIDETMTEEQAVEEIHTAVQNSVSYHMIADVEVASFLSSGVDSNYLTASLHDQGGDIKTFTVGFETADGEKYNEISYAKQASDHLGVENYNHVITEDEFWDSLAAVQWHMDEPSADPAAVALYFVDREAAKQVKAVLSGEGSDEFFGGYPIYQTPLENARLSRIPKPLLRLGSKILGMFGVRGANYLYRAGTPIEEQFIGNAYIFSDAERAGLLKREPSDTRPQDITASYYREVAKLDDVTKMQYIDMNLWLVGDILLKTDKMAMAHSLESRVPFLDKEVWSVARRLPTGLKVGFATTKTSLRKAAQKLLPQRFCEKQKLGFPVPIRVWLKQDKYYDRIRASFTAPVAERYFDTGKLVALLDEHKRGDEDNSRKIWTVYTFLVWHAEYFVDR